MKIVLLFFYVMLTSISLAVDNKETVSSGSTSSRAYNLARLTHDLMNATETAHIESLARNLSKIVGEGLGETGITPDISLAMSNPETQNIIENAICAIERVRMTPDLPFVYEYLPTTRNFSSDCLKRSHQEVVFVFAHAANLVLKKNCGGWEDLISTILRQEVPSKLWFYTTPEAINMNLSGRLHRFLGNLNWHKPFGAVHIFSGDATKAWIAAPSFYSTPVSPVNNYQQVALSDRVLVFSDACHFAHKNCWAKFLSTKQRPTYVNASLDKIQRIAPVLESAAGFIQKSKIPNTVLATQNVRYCVNATIHNREDEMSGMGHLNIRTNIPSLSYLLESVRNNRLHKDMTICLISSYMSYRLYAIHNYIESAGYSVKFVDVSYAGISNSDTCYMTTDAGKFIFIYPSRYYNDYQKSQGIFDKNYDECHNLAMTAGDGTLFHIPSQSPFLQKLKTLEDTLYDVYSRSWNQSKLDRNYFNTHIKAFRDYLASNVCFVPMTSVYEIANLCEYQQEYTPVIRQIAYYPPMQFWRHNPSFYEKMCYSYFPYFTVNLIYALNCDQTFKSTN